MIQNAWEHRTDIGGRAYILNFAERHDELECESMAQAIHSCIARFPSSMMVLVGDLKEQSDSAKPFAESASRCDLPQADRISPSGYPRCGSFNGTKE